jgi:iron complex transport system substrate-binding protein
MLLVLVLLSGCSGKSMADRDSDGSGQTESAQTEQDAKEQDSGQSVQEGKKIAALDSFSGEVMVMIGAGEQMVSCPNGVKSDEMLQEIYPGLTDIEVVQSGGDINAEALLALDPDLILIKESMYNNEGVREKIEKLNIPYEVIGYSSVEEQIDMLETIGSIVGGEAEEKANEIVAYYRDVVARVEAAAATIPEDEKKTVFHTSSTSTMTHGEDSLVNDWITMVGCKDVSADAEGLKSSGNSYYTSREQIFLWDPDIVIAQEKSIAEEYLTSDEWAGLDAVENGCVYNIPVSATRWGAEGSMETFFAMMWLGTNVYPEAYKDFDVQQEVTDFYQKYENISIDDAKYEQILSGEGIRKSAQNGGGNSQ